MTLRHAFLGRPLFARLSLQAKATALVAGVCLIVIGLDAVSLQRERAGDIVRGRESAANLARAVAQHAEDNIRAVDGSLAGLVERLEAEGAPAAVDRFSGVLGTQMTALPQLNGILAADADGTLFATST
jgi:hypothetical protein